MRLRVGRATQKYPRTFHNGPSRKDDPILQPHEEEALAVGRACRDLIESPAYATVMQSLEAFHVTAMVAAPEGPIGVDAREHHHRLLCALRELAGDFAMRTLAADELEARMGEDEEDLDPE